MQLQRENIVTMYLDGLKHLDTQYTSSLIGLPLKPVATEVASTLG